MNQMKKLRIEKITLNMGVGEAGESLEKAVKILKTITNRTPVQTKTMKRIPAWGVRPNLTIGCKVTLRGKEAEKLLIRLLSAVDNKIKPSNFDKLGNFSFGIHEHINIPGVDYNVELGIRGLDVSVTLERPGYRVKRRKNKSKIGIKHLINKEDSIDFVSKTFGVTIKEESE